MSEGGGGGGGLTLFNISAGLIYPAEMISCLQLILESVKSDETINDQCKCTVRKTNVTLRYTERIPIS
jgi:hypothetical protein